MRYRYRPALPTRNLKFRPAPAVLRRKRAEILTNKLILSLGIELSYIERNNIVKHFSTSRTFNSNNPSKTPNELRLEKNELYEKHYSNINKLENMQNEHKDICLSVRERLDDMTDDLNESQKVLLKQLENQYDQTKSDLRFKLIELDKNTNREGNVNTNTNSDSESISSSGSLDVANEERMLQANRDLVENENRFLDSVRRLVSENELEFAEEIAEVDGIMQNKNRLTDEFIASTVEQKELFDKYKILKEECSKEEMSDRGSIIDDFADVSTEMPDYFAGDD